MHSKNNLSERSDLESIKQFTVSNWNKLTEGQKNYAKKAWGIITYKWRWQIAINIPYLALFILDRSIPAVHKFDIALLVTITSKLPIPNFVSSWMGL